MEVDEKHEDYQYTERECIEAMRANERMTDAMQSAMNAARIYIGLEFELTYAERKTLTGSIQDALRDAFFRLMKQNNAIIEQFEKNND